MLLNSRNGKINILSTISPHPKIKKIICGSVLGSHQGSELASILIECNFEFTKISLAKFEFRFFLFNFASWSRVIFTEFMPSSSNFYQV